MTSQWGPNWDFCQCSCCILCCDTDNVVTCLQCLEVLTYPIIQYCIHIVCLFPIMPTLFVSKKEAWKFFLQSGTDPYIVSRSTSPLSFKSFICCWSQTFSPLFSCQLKLFSVTAILCSRAVFRSPHSYLGYSLMFQLRLLANANNKSLKNVGNKKHPAGAARQRNPQGLINVFPCLKRIKGKWVNEYRYDWMRHQKTTDMKTQNGGE